MLTRTLDVFISSLVVHKLLTLFWRLCAACAACNLQLCSITHGVDHQLTSALAATLQELQEWCGDVPHDHARAIRCLQDHQERPGFGQPCREELVHHQEHAASDYRRA
jgi:hypothetical protein